MGVDGVRTRQDGKYYIYINRLQLNPWVHTERGLTNASRRARIGRGFARYVKIIATRDASVCTELEGDDIAVVVARLDELHFAQIPAHVLPPHPRF